MIVQNDASRHPDVKSKYELLEVLGSGAFGVVRKCRHKRTGQLAAVKTIDKSKCDDPEKLQREIELLREVHHPHIIELYDIYEDEERIHLVTELCTGGELYDKVVEKAESDEGHFSEDDAGIIVRDILDAIRYIHDELNIVHRDLKPENFLLTNENDDAAVKIIDFGLSRRNDSPFGIMTTRVGTPYYVAPEVLMQDYTFKCDIWSIGVITYILLCGFAPFAGEDDSETIYLVKTASLAFPSPEWDMISDDAKDFVTHLLQRNPDLRPTAAEALKHPWIAQHVVEPGIPPPRPFQSDRRSRRSGDTTSGTSSGSDGDGIAASAADDGNKARMVEIRMDSQRQTAFQKFLANLKIQKAMSGTAAILTPKEAKHLGQVFRKVDQDRDGQISVQDLDLACQSSSFSTSVKQNLKQVRRHLISYPKISLDIRPFMGFMDTRAKSDPEPIIWERQQQEEDEEKDKEGNDEEEQGGRKTQSSSNIPKSPSSRYNKR